MSQQQQQQKSSQLAQHVGDGGGGLAVAVIQRLNWFLHQRFWIGVDDFIYTSFWTVVLGIIVPCFVVPLLWIIFVVCNIILPILMTTMAYLVVLPSSPIRSTSTKDTSCNNDGGGDDDSDIDDSVDDDSIGGTELAVIITGCDSGFGYEAVQRLIQIQQEVERGHRFKIKVFAGCYNLKETRQRFDTTMMAMSGSSTTTTTTSIIPFQLDVTDQSDIDNAVKLVNDWLMSAEGERMVNDPNAQERVKNEGKKPSPRSSIDESIPRQLRRPSRMRPPRRLLHAIINNAGVGKIGQVDWLTIDDYQWCMDVNAFGPVRMCQAFLPILKRQQMQQQRERTAWLQHQKQNDEQRFSSHWVVSIVRLCRSLQLFLLKYMPLSSYFKSQSYHHLYHRPRIINLSSTAGFVAFGGFLGSAYFMSKHALDAFTQTLRLEAAKWNIDVISVNPSFHKTPLLDKTSTAIETTQLSPTIQRQYGQRYVEKFGKHCNWCMSISPWDSSNVVDTLVSMIVIETSPSSSSRLLTPTQVLVGMDAKYSLTPLRMVPEWCRERLTNLMVPNNVPAAMTSTTTVFAASSEEIEEMNGKIDSRSKQKQEGKKQV